MEYQYRKYPRLKKYDYSLPGYYYVTIHNASGAPLLSKVEPGAAHSRASVILTQAGLIAQSELLLLEKRFIYINM